ncbi:MAG: MBL fold metallo-hydrolase [Candidatus Aquicultorales bacterium]
MKLTVLDGAGCIGGNKIHVESGGKGIFLDFGMNFSSFGRYFEEFLKPRGTRGIHDFLELGLVPPVKGLYREDLFPSGYAVRGSLTLPVDAVWLSHAHIDHTGNLSLLRTDIPVYTSGMSALIMKSMQDAGQAGLEREIAYTASKCSDPGGAIVNEKNCSRMLRNVFIVSDEDLGKLNELWPQSFYASIAIDGALLQRAGKTMAGMRYKAFPVDHSILGASALALETDAGWVVYTGDLRLHGSQGDKTREFAKQARKLKPKILIVEGTRAGGAAGRTECGVKDNCHEVVKRHKGKLVVADFGPRNIERLLSFLEIAKAEKRRLAVTASDAFTLNAMHLADPSIPEVIADEALCIFGEVKAKPPLWERDYILPKCRDKYVDPSVIKKSQGDYIVAFSFFDMNDLLDVAPNGGAYIYSSCEAFNEEMEIDMKRLRNWIDYFGLEPYGVSEEEDSYYHCSGHISGPELLDLIREISPEIVVPVHTENPRFFLDNLGGEFKVIIPDEGKTIEL